MPNDQFSFATSTRLIQTSSRRRPSAREVVGDAAEERALLLQRAAARQRDLDDDDVVRARDAEVARVVDQVARLVLGEELEAIVRRHVDRLDQRAVHRVADSGAGTPPACP